MFDTPRRRPPPGAQRHYSHPDPDMTDEEIEAWVEHERSLGVGVLSSAFPSTSSQPANVP